MTYRYRWPFIPPQIEDLETESTRSTRANADTQGVDTADTQGTAETLDTAGAPSLDTSNTVAVLTPSLRIVTNGSQLFLRTALSDGSVEASKPAGSLEDLVAAEFHGSPKALRNIRTLIKASRC